MAVRPADDSTGCAGARCEHTRAAVRVRSSPEETGSPDPGFGSLEEASSARSEEGRHAVRIVRVGESGELNSPADLELVLPGPPFFRVIASSARGDQPWLAQLARLAAAGVVVQDRDKRLAAWRPVTREKALSPGPFQ